MERLTSTEIIAGHYHNIPTVLDMQQVVDRLAAYEETGLEPEEIKSALDADAIIKLCAQALGVSADRLRELAAADRDGRAVVLPCKVGDLLSKLEKLQNSAEDAAETYTTGYRYGHRNGQAELIRYILGTGTGSVSEAEAALKEQEGYKYLVMICDEGD